jgi:hypothetical protein
VTVRRVAPAVSLSAGVGWSKLAQTVGQERRLVPRPHGRATHRGRPLRPPAGRYRPGR